MRPFYVPRIIYRGSKRPDQAPGCGHGDREQHVCRGKYPFRELVEKHPGSSAQRSFFLPGGRVRISPHRERAQTRARFARDVRDGREVGGPNQKLRTQRQPAAAPIQMSARPPTTNDTNAKWTISTRSASQLIVQASVQLTTETRKGENQMTLVSRRTYYRYRGLHRKPSGARVPLVPTASPFQLAAPPPGSTARAPRPYGLSAFVLYRICPAFTTMPPESSSGLSRAGRSGLTRADVLNLHTRFERTYTC